MPSSLSIMVAATLTLLTPSCTATQPPAPAEAGEVVFEGGLQELLPHHDGDQLVHRTQREGRTSVTVERITAKDGGDFILDTTLDGKAIGRMHWRDDGAAILLVSETFLDGNFLVYSPPLVYLRTPVRNGVLQSNAKIQVVRISDSKVLATGSAEQKMAVKQAASPPGSRDIEVRMERDIRLSKGPFHLVSTIRITPGIGEVAADSTLNGSIAIHSELLCATIGGRRIGDCGDMLPAK